MKKEDEQLPSNFRQMKRLIVVAGFVASLSASLSACTRKEQTLNPSQSMASATSTPALPDWIGGSPGPPPPQP
jgi:hypothetical protein